MKYCIIWLTIERCVAKVHYELSYTFEDSLEDPFRVRE